MPFIPVKDTPWWEIGGCNWSDLNHNTWGDHLASIAFGVEIDVNPTVFRFGAATLEVGIDIFVEPVAGSHNYYRELKEMLPWYERESAVIDASLRGAAAILAYVEAIMLRLDRELFLDTAVEMLDVWEAELGITESTRLTLDERRANIRAHWWAMHGAVTEEVLKQVARAYTNGEIEIIRQAEHGAYVFKFISILGVPKRLVDLEFVFQRLIHAGYDWDWAYRYNTWGVVKDQTWQTLAARTWENARSEVFD